jgi:hypothetical protein
LPSACSTAFPCGDAGDIQLLQRRQAGLAMRFSTHDNDALLRLAMLL